jgi:hypothetical protein
MISVACAVAPGALCGSEANLVSGSHHAYLWSDFVFISVSVASFLCVGCLYVIKTATFSVTLAWAMVALSGSRANLVFSDWHAYLWSDLFFTSAFAASSFTSTRPLCLEDCSALCCICLGCSCSEWQRIHIVVLRFVCLSLERCWFCIAFCAFCLFPYIHLP